MEAGIKTIKQGGHRLFEKDPETAAAVSARCAGADEA
jgi:hypothetical protein